MNGLRDSGAVYRLPDIDLDSLLTEIARYLGAVDAFRAAGHEPTWLPESVAATSVGTSPRFLR